MVPATDQRPANLLRHGVRVPQVVIENPILNSPFDEPTRHFRFDDDGITDEIVEGRRDQRLLRPDRRSRRRRASSCSSTPSGRRTGSRRTSSSTASAQRVALWRERRLLGVTPTTARLLEYWTDPDREKQLFFCQIEALETAIYITEVAEKYGDAWIENELRDGQRRRPTPACRASRSRWRPARQDGRHGDAHRLAGAQQARQPAGRPVLRRLPRSSRPASRSATGCACCCRTTRTTTTAQLDIVPPSCCDRARAGQDRHHQLPRLPAAREGRRRQADQGDPRRRARRARSPRRPTRWCAASAASWARKKNIVVINDEAHHCYRRKPDARGREADAATSAVEAKQRDEEARVWISGLEAVTEQDRRQGRSTTCRPRRSSCAAPATRRARSSRGSCPTSR